MSKRPINLSIFLFLLTFPLSLYSNQINFAEKLLNSYKYKSNLKVAILPVLRKKDFETRVDSQVYNKIFEEVFNDRRFKIVERELLSKILKEHEFQQTGMIKTEDMIKLGRLSGADLIIIIRVKNDVYDFRIVRIDNGEIVAFASALIPEETDNDNVLNSDEKDVLDSRGNRYVSRKLDLPDAKNFILTGDILIQKTYRQNGTGWAGIFIRADRPNAIHGRDTGYLCYIRVNGDVGIHSSIIDDIRKNKSTSFYGEKKNSFKIIAKDNDIKYFINDVLIIHATNAFLKQGNILLNVGGVRAKFFNINLSKPSSIK